MMVFSVFSELVSEASEYTPCTNKDTTDFYFKYYKKSIPKWEDKLLKRKT